MLLTAEKTAENEAFRPLDGTISSRLLWPVPRHATIVWAGQQWMGAKVHWHGE